MGEFFYTFYCLSETLPKAYLLLVGTMTENGVIMKLFVDVGIAVSLVILSNCRSNMGQQGTN